jgi:hypothetical protein
METVFKKYNIDLHKLLSVSTGGCSSMVGTKSGSISLLRKHLNKHDLLTCHCILRQDSLAAKFGEDFKSAMKDAILSSVSSCQVH